MVQVYTIVLSPHIDLMYMHTGMRDFAYFHYSILLVQGRDLLFLKPATQDGSSKFLSTFVLHMYGAIVLCKYSSIMWRWPYVYDG